MGGVFLLDYLLELNEKFFLCSFEEEIYNYIVGLLDKVVVSLFDICSNSDYGKLSVGVCYVLKVRVVFYVYKYDVVEVVVCKVMGMNVYGLYDNYGDLF